MYIRCSECKKEMEIDDPSTRASTTNDFVIFAIVRFKCPQCCAELEFRATKVGRMVEIYGQ